MGLNLTQNTGQNIAQNTGPNTGHGIGLNTGLTPKPKAIQPSQLPPPPKFVPRPSEIEDISEGEEDDEDAGPVPPPMMPQVQAFT